VFSTNTRSGTITTSKLRFLAGGGALLLVLALGTILYSITQPSFLRTTEQERFLLKTCAFRQCFAVLMKMQMKNRFNLYLFIVLKKQGQHNEKLH
jgi:hypothetical protein